MTAQHWGGRDEEKGKGESPLGLEAGLARAPVLPSKSGASEVTILLRAGAASKPVAWASGTSAEEPGIIGKYSNYCSHHCLAQCNSNIHSFKKKVLKIPKAKKHF